LTFTRRAAREMVQRARSIVERALPGAGAIVGGTFHSLAHRTVRLHASALGLPAGFGVLDAGDAADLLDLVRSLRGSRWQLFIKIQFPGALPYIFSGMKVAAILAVAGAIVGEFLGSDRGLGYLMLQVQVTLDTAAMFMAVILITLIGVILYALVLALERMLVVPDARLA